MLAYYYPWLRFCVIKTQTEEGIQWMSVHFPGWVSARGLSVWHLGLHDMWQTRNKHETLETTYNNRRPAVVLISKPTVTTMIYRAVDGRIVMTGKFWNSKRGPDVQRWVSSTVTPYEEHSVAEDILSRQNIKKHWQQAQHFWGGTQPYRGGGSADVDLAQT